VAAAYPLLAAILLACWALGALVEHWLSAPANRWLRREHAGRGAPGAHAAPAGEHRISPQ
jgi:hypothetical protein